MIATERVLITDAFRLCLLYLRLMDRKNTCFRSPVNSTKHNGINLDTTRLLNPTESIVLKPEKIKRSCKLHDPELLNRAFIIKGNFYC